MGFLEHLHSNVYKPWVTLTSNGGCREKRGQERGGERERLTDKLTDCY